MLKLSFGEKFTSPCALLLGGFDGLHRGHETLLSEARKTGLPVGLTTIYGAKAGGDVFTAEERAEIFERAGLDFSIGLDFSAIRDLSATEFLNGIFSALDVKTVVCGEDFRFGKGAFAGVSLLKEVAPCPVRVLPICFEHGEKLAISAVKEKLAMGDVTGANNLLVSPFFLRGVVEHGRREGGKLGFPTANLSYPAQKHRLKEGVYGGYSILNGKKYRAIVNVGARPTFGVEEKKVEAHFLGFSGDLYGATIDLCFEKFLRPIVRFSSVEALKAQLESDKKSVGDTYD